MIFDPMLSPSILASGNSSHGVYFYDSVLCRLEVKSKLRKEDFATFVKSSQRLSQLHLAVSVGNVRQVAGAMNFLVSFESEVAAGRELEFLRAAMTCDGLDPVSGIVSSMCIADRGFWLLGEHDGKRQWKGLAVAGDGDPLAYFTRSTR